MDKWQRSFASKLESVRMHWQERFEHVAEEAVAPVFGEFDAFTTARGFAVTSPTCDAGARHYKFGLTENAYLMLWFRLNGFEALEAHAEVVVPGENPQTFRVGLTHLSDASSEWVAEQFRGALDRFVDAFDAASRKLQALAGNAGR